MVEGLSVGASYAGLREETSHVCVETILVLDQK